MDEVEFVPDDKRRMVIVEWQDAACNASWQENGVVLGPVTVWTAGFLTHEEEAFVMISGSVSEDGGFNQTMTIPKSMFVSMKEIG